MFPRGYSVFPNEEEHIRERSTNFIEKFSEDFLYSSGLIVKGIVIELTT